MTAYSSADFVGGIGRKIVPGIDSWPRNHFDKFRNHHLIKHEKPSMDIPKEQYDTLVAELVSLRKENEMLKSLLEEHGWLDASDEENNGVGSINSQKPLELYSSIVFPDLSLGIEDRVALFRSLFRGREDVFARRWQSKTTGKCGYQPVCVNEWRRGVCDKKKFKCSECPNRQFAPLGYQDIYRHLEGRNEHACDVIGLYALMQDNACAFLCTDFDDKSCEHGYNSDVLAFVEVCRDWKIPYSIERSRSGNGAHVWIFFECVVPAWKARKMGNAILTEAMNRDGRLSFNSYDRFFPNQDTMPEGGFGNLVALPLQGQARKSLNSVFVDDEFRVYKDQWAYLYQVKKMNEEAIDVVLASSVTDDLSNLTTSSESKLWSLPAAQNITIKDFMGSIEIVRSDKIYIPQKSVTAKVVHHLKRIAAFKNPEFYVKENMRMSTFDVPRIISCADVTDDYVAMPRGCEEAIASLISQYGIHYNIKDETNHGSPISVSFKGKEREEQLDAINALLPHTNGVLHATTAFGKTVTAASMIARRKVNTLILVHTKALLDQWHERLTEFLDIDYTEPDEPKKRGRKKSFSSVGCLDSSKNTLHGIVDIALMQSCLDDGEVKPFVQDYGMVIVDECHHVSSVTFEKVMKCVRAQYVYGLTATPIRKDGHQPIIFMQCGPIRFSADAKSQIEKQTFKRYLIPRFTSFRSLCEDKKYFTPIRREIAEDEVRNRLIVEDVKKALDKGRTPILLADLTSHVDILARMLTPYCKNVVRLTGTGTAKEKTAEIRRLQEIAESEPLVIVATGKYVGEGFDYPRLDTLFLVSPISWKGRLQQYAGRLHREYEGKRDVRIYDYIDIYEPMCENMYHKRLKGYASICYITLNQSEPSLFDHVDDLGLDTAESQIFNGMTFRKPFAKDMDAAKKSIIISSPRLYGVDRNAIVSHLHELSAKGIEVMVFAKVDNEQTKLLKHHGFSVHINPNLSIHCTIIDKSTVWYGSINVLGYASQEDNEIRLQDCKLATELIKVTSINSTLKK